MISPAGSSLPDYYEFQKNSLHHKADWTDFGSPFSFFSLKLFLYIRDYHPGFVCQIIFYLYIVRHERCHFHLSFSVKRF